MADFPTTPSPTPTIREPRVTEIPVPLLGACGCGSGCSCGCQSGGSCQCGGSCG
ncbi:MULTISPECIES: hypothetical protein [Streptomyces]|uniref:hypothetical protein n=1 Tax=Streptomyces TaxID=1883 RepID=UPI00142DDBB4|nr:MULTISPECIES: hypothetical protein [Streptomyces]